MKKLILILVALIGLVGSASAETVHIKGHQYLVSNSNIGTIEYLVSKASSFSAFYDLAEACGRHCIKYIKNNKELDPEVRVLTHHFGLTASVTPMAYTYINVYDGTNYSTYIFY